MKTIGLLGGMSWESTALYYELLNEGVRDRLGGLHSAECVIYSVEFADVETMQANGQWDAAGELLADKAKAIEAAGADMLLLCTNTMHIVAEKIENAISIPFVHLADATARAIKARGLTKVGLLGTAFTMDKPFYKDRLVASGIETIVPNETDRSIIHRVIYDELCLGVVREESRDEYRRIIEQLIADGAEGIIAGCTEIELLIDDKDSAVPLFRTTRLHVEAAIEMALRE